MNDKLFIELPIVEAVWNKCAEFAGLHDTTYYAKRGQTNPDKIKHDAFVGKLAECHVWYTLKDFCPITKPDFNIYPPKQKSWRQDLHIQFDPVIPIHVKGQDEKSAGYYGVSWVCQYENKNGRGGKDLELFKNPGNSLIICVSVHCFKRVCVTKVIVPAATILEQNLYGQMRLEQHRQGKRAIYEEECDLGPGMKEHGFYQTIPSVMEEWNTLAVAR